MHELHFYYPFPFFTAHESAAIRLKITKKLTSLRGRRRTARRLVWWMVQEVVKKMRRRKRMRLTMWIETWKMQDQLVLCNMMGPTRNHSWRPSHRNIRRKVW